ncbi:MAG: hypothetical protein PVJ57_09985 [Phycisphaerae bacterium]
MSVRDGSDQATRQWVWGTRYIDEPLFMDVNADPTANDDCDPDAGSGKARVAAGLCCDCSNLIE